MPSRAEARAAVALGLVLALGCTPAPRDLEVGIHRVRLVPPAGWEVLAEGGQSFVRRGETTLSLTDLGPANARGFVHELRSARAVWLAGRRRDAFARVRELSGPPLRFATSDQRSQFWKSWYDVIYPRPEAADSAAIGMAFDDLIQGAGKLPVVAPRSLEEYVLERWSDAGRREIQRRSAPSIHGHTWIQLTTWDRVSHMAPRQVAYLDDSGYLLVVAVEHGDPRVTGPAFERMMSTIEVATDTTRAR